MESHDSALALEQETSVPLPLFARVKVAGSHWEVSTDCEEILAIMQDHFQPTGPAPFPPDLRLCFHVDLGLPDHGRQIRPHFRALDHLYYGTFGSGDSILVDQRNRRVVGLFSPATARDVRYWKRVILPCLIGIACACVGITPVHCACVVKDGRGLLLHGESGSGKSTLALTLSLDGFSYLSDDCTYISDSDSRLRCWGLSAPLKLLPEAVTYFPNIGNLAPCQTLNGELAFEIDPTETFRVRRSQSCEPHWLIFIERTQESTVSFRTISSAEAAFRLASDLEILPPCIDDQRNHQLAVIDTLVQRRCWVLRHGIQPKALALALAEFCSHN